MGRRKHSPDFKKKIALEAIREQKSINQIAKKFQIHPVQVSEWKKQLLESCGSVFLGDIRQESREEEIAKYFKFYNRDRPHKALGNQTPAIMHFGK